MKSIFTCIIALLAITSTIAQNTIKGKVTDSYSTPLEAVTILVKGTKNGTITDTDGNFELNNVQKNDILLVSYVGYKTKEVIIHKGNTHLNIILFEGNELLQEVTIKSGRNNKFSRKKTAYVSKLPLKDIENSQVYSTVTNELLQSQVATNFEEALVNATGVDKRWESTGRVGLGTTFYSIRGFSSQPALIDGVPSYTFAGADPSYIERIEVLKGPSATLFGSTVNSLGGLINIVTKKPFKGFGGSASYTVGSFGLHRVSADINTPLAKGENTPYFRLNTSYLTQDSFQDAGFRNTFYIAPSLTYKVNNRLNLSMGIEYSKTKQTNPTMIFLRKGYQMASNNIESLDIDPTKSFTDNDVFIENPIFSTRTIADYKLSDNWNSQTIFASSHQKSEGYYQYMAEGVGVFFLNPNPTTPQQVGLNAFVQNYLKNNVLTRIIDNRDESASTINMQQNFTGDFNIGNVRNRLVVGLDFIKKNLTDHNKIVNPATRFPVIYGFFQPDGTPLDNVFFTPTVVETEYPLNRSILDPVFNQIPANDIEIKDQTFAAYISDVINFTPELSVMLGLRVDYFDKEGNTKIEGDEYNKTNFSPKFGVVYQPIREKLSLFANYQTGFVNLDPVFDFQQQKYISLDPEKATQYEFGFKTSVFNGKLNTNLSYYNITVNDRNIIDTANPFRRAVVDEITSKGVEFELNANPVNGLNIRGSIAYNDSEVTKATQASILGRRIEEAGPEVLYNFWADYKFDQNTSLKNLGLGFGFNGASAHNAMNNPVSGNFELPSYTILNAALYYDHSKFRIGIKANNLSDEQYYKGWATVNPQAPRSLLGTIMYKF